MKQFLTVVQGRKFQYTLLLGLAAVWFIGPYLAIAGKTPFDTFFGRLLGGFTIFIVLYFYEYFKSSKGFQDDNPLPEDLRIELQTLQKTIKSVLQALYQNPIKSFLFRYKKPWYLVLGPSNAGKSTLLAKGDLNIKGLDNLPPRTITPTKFFNWWLADEAVFIDVGGRYLQDAKDPNKNTMSLFQGFFKLLKRFRSFKPINGLILTVNLQELTINTREQYQLKYLQEIISELLQQFVTVPIYLIITRCDVIEGFSEFFEDLGPEERDQSFGMSFPLATQLQSLPQLFNEQFDSMLTRLNERIIWRIRQEHNLEKVGKIKNFPLQLEFLKSPLAKLLNVLLPSTSSNLRGIFFTSAAQKDTPFDNLTKTVSRAYDVPFVGSGHRSLPPKNFFISEIFKRIIYPESKFFAANNPDHRMHLLASMLIITITAVCGFLFFNSYKLNSQAITCAQQAIKAGTSQTNPELLANKLDLLKLTMAQLNARPHAWYSQIGMHQADKLQKNANDIYKQLLTSQFLPYLVQILENSLQDTQEGKINQLYAALKTYLMLADQKHMDKTYMLAWFDSYWHQAGKDVKEQQSLNDHLRTLLALPQKPVTVNKQLIDNTRTVLNSMPQSRLVLTILQNQYQGSPIKLLPDLAANSFHNIPRELPGIYDITHFKNVYYSEIQKTCQEITNGNWVLGNKAQPAFSDIMLNQLANEVKAIYLNEYAVTWNDILTKIKVENFQTLDQIASIINLLNDTQSPLVQLINTIKNNTQPLSDSVEFNQQVSARFLSLNALSNDVLKNTNQVSLVAVKNYLNKITATTDIDRSCYEAAKSRMECSSGPDAITTLLQQAKMLPEPLQTWHTTIAAESWRIILKNTQTFLNRIWLSTVYPQYQSGIDKRYPIFKDSAIDIPLTDFANFFGNGGAMDTFFKNYLQPFVDNSRLYWEWKNVDGQRLNISQPTLEMFIRAALIQKMFFPEEARVPAITFSLVPVELDPGTQSFSLDLEGQTVQYQKDNEQILSLTWPGPQPNRTQLTFLDSAGKKTEVTATGPWSWFKILDKARLEPTTSPKHFKLSFEANGAGAQYELYTTGVVNPFITGILNAFRCPESLY